MDNRSDKWGSVGRGKKFPQIDALNVVPSWGIATRFSTRKNEETRHPYRAWSLYLAAAERYRPVSQPRRRISIIRDRDCRSRFNDDTKMERSFNKGPAIILSRALIADVCLLCDTRVTCARSFACESRTRYSTATYVSYFFPHSSCRRTWKNYK